MSITLKHLKKVRCRVLDRESGEPVGGVVVHLALRVSDGDSRARLPVSALCSDATGYLSFDLQRLIDAGIHIAGSLLISAPQLGLRDQDLLRALVADSEDESDASEGGSYEGSSWFTRLSALDHAREDVVADARPLDLVFPLWADKAKVKRAGCSTPNLPAIQAPDGVDYAVSPFSFVTSMPVHMDGDCCETLAPSTLPVQEHSFYKVVIHHERNDDDSPNLNVKPVDVAEALDHQDAAGVRFGHVLEYKQRWYSLGHALGEIKYSLPLAPGESTQLAVVEWSREDTASRYDKVRGTEFLDHDLRRDRSIVDSIEAGLSESQGGSSFNAGASSGMVYDTVVYGKYTGNWALGGGSSNSWGNRDILADIGNELHDNVAQGTSFVRSQRSTVIVQATQAERNTLQTRRVANHNHCHALTIQYYEVLRHYRLETHYIGRRNAILIPFKPITDFTSDLAQQFQTVLERALLDDQLGPCFHALVRLAIGALAYGEQREEATESDDETNEEEDSGGDAGAYFTGEKKDITVDSHDFATSTGLSIEKGSTLNLTAKLGPLGEVKFGHGQGGGFGLKGAGDGRDTDSRWPGWHAVRPLPAGALCAEIGGDQWVVGFGGPHVAEEEGVLTLFFNDPTPSDNKGTATVDVKVRKPEPVPTPAVDKPDPSAAAETGPYTQGTDRICQEKLLRHLNANLGHYNRAIWMLMDPVQRRMYLEKALGASNELLYAIDDIPLTVSGHRVVFPFNGPMPKATWFEEQSFDPRKSIVTLPTRGLFAEAQLGHCCACEERDITRMWDWTEMTVEEPPAIGGITPGPRGEMPQLSPTQLPANVIQIAQPPDAPDPTGVGAALGLLGAANVFRDMSGLDEASALLGKLVDGTISSVAGVRQAAGDAKKKVDGARDAPSPDGSKGRQTPKERLDNYQVLEKMANEGTFRLTDEQLSDLAKEWLSDDWRGSGEDEGVGLQYANALVGEFAKATGKAALEFGSDITKRIKDDFFDHGDLKLGSVEEAFVHLRGYSDPGDYLGPPSGSAFDDLTMHVQLINLGGGNILDGLYTTYEIKWDDGYTLDPDVVKPDQRDKKPYLPYIQCKQRIRAKPIDPRGGQAVKEVVVKADVYAEKQPIPALPPEVSKYPYSIPPAGGLFAPEPKVSAEFFAVLRLNISIEQTFVGGNAELQDTVEIPLTQHGGLRKAAYAVLNKKNGRGFEVDWPTADQLENPIIITY